MDLQSDDIRARERSRRRREPLWGVLSFAFHIALFAVIILMTPARSLVFEKKERANPAADLSSDRIEQVSDSLSRIRVSELLEQLEALQAVLHNMDLMKEQLQRDYDDFAQQNAGERKDAEAVRRELLAFVDEVEGEQRKVLAEHGPILSVVTNLVAEESGDIRDAERSEYFRRTADELRNGSYERVNTAQANAQNTLDRIRIQAEYAGFAKSSEAADVLRDAQTEAAKMQNRAQDETAEIAEALSEYRGYLARFNEARLTRERHEGERRRAETSRRNARLAEAEMRERLAEDEASLVQARAAAESAQEKLDRLNAELKVARQAKQEPCVREIWGHVCTANGRLRAAKDAAQRAWGDLAVSSNAWKQETAVLRHLDRRIGELATNAIPRTVEYERSMGGRVRDISSMSRRNDRALQIRKFGHAEQVQRDVLGRMSKLRELLRTEEPELVRIAPSEHVENQLVREASAGKSMADAYELARRIEDAITDSYKDLKATQTAIAKKISYQAAQRVTDVVRTERREANRAVLEAKVRTKEALDAKKQEQAEVVREAEGMVDTSLQMMKEAMEIVMKGDDASEHPPERGSDDIRWLTEEDFRARESAEARRTRLAEMSAAAEYQVRLQDAAAENEQERAKDMAGLMERTADLTASDTKSAPPPLRAEDEDLLPGNRLSVSDKPSDGLPARWAYVKSWHVIGPFPNPDRVNLRRKFPPESVIDLDATYPGADGKMVSWQFMQANNALNHRTYRADVVPDAGKEREYVIWYAVADVFFDEACDRWLAIGSDDRSDLWVNQVPVWGSSNKLKKWWIAEGFRRVHFKKGHNEILIRVENGHCYCNWSVCIALTDGN